MHLSNNTGSKMEEDRDKHIFVFAMCKVDHTRT